MKSTGNSKTGKTDKVQQREKSAWRRLGTPCLEAGFKGAVYAAVTSVLEAESSTGCSLPHLRMGPNSVMKLIEKGICRSVVVCRDSPPALHDHLIEAAYLRQLPIVMVPKAVAELSAIFGVKSISCFAVACFSEGTALDVDTTDTVPVALDRLHDLLLSAIRRSLVAV
jgi:ribosomal protein L7Ae-like RNA K-turn-binding protein